MERVKGGGGGGGGGGGLINKVYHEHNRLVSTLP